MRRSIRVLLVEDSKSDVYIIEHCLSEAGLACITTVISDGEAALRFLRDRRDPPELIILDLNLPKLDGLDILKELMHTSELPAAPIVVLSSSESPKDKAGVAAIPHSCFLKKPMDLDGFIRIGESIEQFWRSHQSQS